MNQLAVFCFILRNNSRNIAKVADSEFYEIVISNSVKIMSCMFPISVC